MLPHKHLIYSSFLAAILFLIIPEIGLMGFLLIVLASILLDVDHYIYYIYKKKNFNLIKSYRWFRAKNEKFKHLSLKERRKVYRAFLFFHGLEIPAVLFILIFLVSEYFSFIFIGASFHLILDYYDQWIPGERKDKLSIAHDFLKYKKLKYLE